MYERYIFANEKGSLTLTIAIVLGNIYAEGDITFGPGLVQAYLLEEKMSHYTLGKHK